MAAATLAAPPCSSMAARESPSPMVAQAAYRPPTLKGWLRRAKLLAAHWLSRSPASTRSTSSACIPPRSRAWASARCWKMDSAFSQLAWPQKESVSISSK